MQVAELDKSKNLNIQKFLFLSLPGEWPAVDCVLILTRKALEIKREKEQKGVQKAHKGFSDSPSFL